MGVAQVDHEDALRVAEIAAGAAAAPGGDGRYRVRFGYDRKAVRTSPGAR
jgi:hypothetical protein